MSRRLAFTETAGDCRVCGRMPVTSLRRPVVIDWTYSLFTTLLERTNTYLACLCRGGFLQDNGPPKIAVGKGTWYSPKWQPPRRGCDLAELEEYRNISQQS
jgi:hypothetical protein